MSGSPDDAYLAKIGRLAYDVGYLEWSVLGRIDHDDLPDALARKVLMDKTTNQLSLAIRVALDGVTDPALHAWLARAARALKEAGDLRNHVLHARPATFDAGGTQRLRRHTAGDERRPRVSFWISDEWLDDAIATVRSLIVEVGRLAPRA